MSKNIKENEFLDDIFLFPFEVKEVMSTLSESMGWQITKLNVPETWKVTKGEEIKVLVLDTGYCTHSDLDGGMIREESKSFLSDEIFPDDLNGHGSHVCGIIGARKNNQGMVGVAPECKIITAKVLGKNGSGGFKSIRDALEYAIKVKPDVINMSLGSRYYDPQMHKLIKKLYDMNIPIIAASGNDSRGNAVNYPAKYPEVICVTAFDKRGKPARFNSTGPEAEFSAPGVDIRSTWIGNRYVTISGTSMATPFMAGVVALLLAKHKKQEAETGKNDCKTVEQVREHLVKYTDDKGAVGRDNTWGYGVVDPVKVIGALEEQEEPEPAPEPQPPKPAPKPEPTPEPEPTPKPKPKKPKKKKTWFQKLLRKLFGWLG